MRLKYKPILLGAAGALALTACTDPSMMGGSPGGDPNRTRQGATAGAILGGLAGATRGDDANDRRQNAAVGALVGGAVGAGVGNVLDRQAAELRGEFGNQQISVVNRGNDLLVRMPQDVLFAVDSAEVSSGIRSDLRVLADNLGRYERSNVQIIGHTDSDGTAAYNQQLSERRARSVASVLTGYGVPSSRLTAIGRGEDQPVADNLTQAGKAQNRRVDIVIVPY